MDIGLVVSNVGMEAFKEPVRVRVNWDGVRLGDPRVFAIYISAPLVK